MVEEVLADSENVTIRNAYLLIGDTEHRRGRADQLHAASVIRESTGQQVARERLISTQSLFFKPFESRVYRFT